MNPLRFDESISFKGIEITFAVFVIYYIIEEILEIKILGKKKGDHLALVESNFSFK